MSLFDASLIQATDNDGNPVAGAVWWFYLTGTSTPANVYSNATLATSLGATVTADAAGWFVPIYMDDSATYRAVLKTAAGATIGGHDIDPANGVATSSGAYTIEQYGGGTSMTGAQNRDAAVDLMGDHNGISFGEAGGSYPFVSLTNLVTPYLLAGGQQPFMLLPPTLKQFDGNGANMTCTNSRGIWGGFVDSRYSLAAKWSYISANLAAGATAIPVTTGEGVKFTAGKWVMILMGSLPYDTREPLVWMQAKILSIATDTLTIDRPVPAAFTIASVTPGDFTATTTGYWTCNKTVIQVEMFEDMVLRDFTVTGVPATGDLEQGLNIVHGRNLTFENVNSYGVGIGISLQYVEGFTITGGRQDATDAFQASVGKAYSFAETRGGLLQGAAGRGARTFVAAEGHAEISAVGCFWDNCGSILTGATWGTAATAFNAQGRSRIDVHDFTATGFGGYNLSIHSNGTAAYDSELHFTGRTTLIHPTEVNSITFKFMKGLLDYQIAGGRELYDFTKKKVWSQRIRLRSGMSNVDFDGPVGGIITDVRITPSTGLTLGAGNQLTDIYVGKGNSGLGSNLITSLTAAKEVAFAFVGGTNGGGTWTGRAEFSRIRISTATDITLDLGTEYVDVEFDIVPDLLSTTAGIWATEGPLLAAKSEVLQRIAVLLPNVAELPVTNPASLDTRNDRKVLGFDTTTQETAFWTFEMPASYTGRSLLVTVAWAAATATTGTIGWGVSLERISTLHDIDGDGFATEVIITAATVNGASGVPSKTSALIAGGNLDGALAGETVRLRVRRDVATDTATGDAQIVSVTVREV